MSPAVEAAASVAVAGLIGLAVGIEREWSGHATGPGARFAGVRTFLLLGLLGGIAGFLVRRDDGPLGLVLVAGGVALAVAAYVVSARRDVPDAVDGTTEAAALVVLALAAIAGLGELRLAAGIAAVVVLALREKSVIQRAVRHIGESELRATFQFAVLALVLLPILPAGPYGPLGGVRPRELWLVVLLISGLNFLGYIAQRAIGRTRGSVVAGMLGGLVSSTAVALTFSRESREPGAAARPLALGVVGACTVLVPRLLVVTLLLQPRLTPRLLPFLLPPFVVGAAWVVLGMRSAGPEENGPPQAPPGSPLRLGSALLMAVAFQATLMLTRLAQGWLGDAGVLASSALLGLTDMDALTYSMARLAGEDGMIRVAATAMGIGVLSNTILKLGVALGLGAGAYRRRAALGLGALAVGSLVGLVIGRL